MNSLLKLVLKLGEIKLEALGINKLLDFNRSILGFFQENEVIWIGLTVLIFSSSIIVILVSHSLFENYSFICTYSGYGAELSLWSLLIYGTYKLYYVTGLYFVVVLLFISLVAIVLKKKKNDTFY